MRYENEKPDDTVYLHRKGAKTQSFGRDLSGSNASSRLCAEKSLGTPRDSRTTREQSAMMRDA